MYCPLRAVAWTIIDSFAISIPVPADLAAANDNDRDRRRRLMREVATCVRPKVSGRDTVQAMRQMPSPAGLR